MSGGRHGVLVETDLIAAFLVAPADRPPLLRRLLETLPCYSTFIQAAEIYAAAPAPDERRTVERALFGLKILGASARYAKTIGDVLTSLGTLPDHRTAIVAAMALESRLPIVTAVAAGRYDGIPELRVLPAALLDRARTSEELLELIG